MKGRRKLMRDVWKGKTRSFASKETENEKMRERFFENMIYREAALKSAAFFVCK